jgi:predicted solute-binding protein
MTFVMEERFFVFWRAGPYNWEICDYEDGPHYDRENYFDESGYETEEQAKKAISEFYNSDYTPNIDLFIVKGYCKTYIR